MINLEEIKLRYIATSVAPWVASIEGRDHESGSHFIMTGIAVGENIKQAKRGEDFEIHGATIADLDFIAHARQDIPALVEEVEKLKQELLNQKTVGVPIDTDGVFEKSISIVENEIKQKLEFKINEWEVLFAEVNISNLNATQIFNWGMLYQRMVQKK